MYIRIFTIIVDAVWQIKREAGNPAVLAYALKTGNFACLPFDKLAFYNLTTLPTIYSLTSINNIFYEKYLIFSRNITSVRAETYINSSIYSHLYT